MNTVPRILDDSCLETHYCKDLLKNIFHVVLPKGDDLEMQTVFLFQFFQYWSQYCMYKWHCINTSCLSKPEMPKVEEHAASREICVCDTSLHVRLPVGILRPFFQTCVTLKLHVYQPNLCSTAQYLRIHPAVEQHHRPDSSRRLSAHLKPWQP